MQIQNKECIFCGVLFGTAGKESQSSREHFWGKDLAKFLDAPPNCANPTKHFETRISANGDRNVMTNPKRVEKGHHLYWTIKDKVCKSCNSGWLNEIQSNSFIDVKKLVTLPNVDCSISNSAPISSWIYSRFLLDLSMYDPFHSIPDHIAGDVTNFRMNRCRDFFRRKVPPDSTMIFSARLIDQSPTATMYNLVTIPVFTGSILIEQAVGIYMVSNLAFVVFSNADLVHDQLHYPKIIKEIWPSNTAAPYPEFVTTAKSFEEIVLSGIESFVQKSSVDLSIPLTPFRRNYADRQL